jgi:predicted nucleic acid-binding protein
MNAMDTNILVYAHDPTDPAQQKCARDLVETLADPVLLWQVAIEHLSAIHKLKNKGMDVNPRDAFTKVRELATPSSVRPHDRPM